MAFLTTKPNGKLVVVISIIGTQKYVYTGTRDKKEAERIRRHVDELEQAAKNNRTVVSETCAWITALYENPAGHRLYDSLGRIGLVETRESVAARISAAEAAAREKARILAESENELDWTLQKLTAQHIASLVDVKQGTKNVYAQSQQALFRWFGEDCRIRDIDANRAEDYQRGLRKEYKQATCSKYIKHAKAFFKRAVRAKVIDANPFADVRPGTDQNPERQCYITPELVQSIIQAAPDSEWKLIIGLAYYAGLRCPSEIYELRWKDVHFDKKYFVVATPKTAGKGRAQKTIPIFPELELLLVAAMASAREGAVHVLDRHRLPGRNLSTQFGRIIRAAGHEVWPKLFNNLRSSRRTALERMMKFTTKSLDEWFGHDSKTANKHYVQLGDPDFQLAAGTWSVPPVAGVSAQGNAQGQGRQLSENDVKTPFTAGNDDSREKHRNLRKQAEKPIKKASRHQRREALSVTPTGIEPVSRP